MKLRPYQVSAIEQIDEHIRNGKKRILLCATMGAGKTTVSAAFIKRCLDYDFPCVFVVRGRELVKNAVDRFNDYGLDLSVAMAGDWRYDPRKLLQVCSIDTMKARSIYPFKGKRCVIFLDEAHFSYDSVFEEYQEAIIIGMTGTPYTDMSNYECYVEPISPQDLRDAGFLVRDKIFCPHLMDVSAVKMTAGDFNRKELDNVVTKSAVVGNIVQDWIDLGDNRPTVCFAVSVEHSKQLAQAFRAEGIPAIHCDSSSTKDERLEAKEGLESGKIKVVCNVDIFSTGWDCPVVGCIILARPSWSLCWYLQAVGRGVRPFGDKSHCIVLDNAGNVFRHGSHFKVREISLEKPEKRKKSKQYENRAKTCENCYLIFDPSEHKSCPDCGWEIPSGDRKVHTVDGKLIEYAEHEDDRRDRRKAMIIERYKKIERTRRAKNFRPVWTFAELFKDFTREEMVHLRLVTQVPSQFLPLQEVHQN